MRRHVKRAVRAAVLGAVPFVLVVTNVRAQEEEIEACTAELAPATVRVEAAAVQVTAHLTQDIGEVVRVDGPGDSGVRLATPEELELIAMAAEEEAGEIEPIVLSADRRTATLWLNTEDAEPGRYTLTIEGATGSCTSEITVEGLGSQS